MKLGWRELSSRNVSVEMAWIGHSSLEINWVVRMINFFSFRVLLMQVVLFMNKFLPPSFVPYVHFKLEGGRSELFAQFAVPFQSYGRGSSFYCQFTCWNGIILCSSNYAQLRYKFLSFCLTPLQRYWDEGFKNNVYFVEVLFVRVGNWLLVFKIYSSCFISMVIKNKNYTYSTSPLYSATF